MLPHGGFLGVPVCLSVRPSVCLSVHFMYVHLKVGSMSMSSCIFIDHEARDIMYFVASVRQCALSRMNRLTYDLDIRVIKCVSVCWM